VVTLRNDACRHRARHVVAPESAPAGEPVAQARRIIYLITEQIRRPVARSLRCRRRRTTGPTTVEEVGGLAGGSLFEPNAAPWNGDCHVRGSIRRRSNQLGAVTPQLEAAFKRVPSVAEAVVRNSFCGPESCTPEASRPLVGESAGLGRIAGWRRG